MIFVYSTKEFSHNNTCYGLVKYEDTELKEEIDDLQDQTIKHVAAKICIAHDFDDSRKYLYQRAHDDEA